MTWLLQEAILVRAHNWWGYASSGCGGYWASNHEQFYPTGTGMANSSWSSSCHGGTGVNLQLKTLGGLCQHKQEGDVLLFVVYRKHQGLITKKELWFYFQHHQSLHLLCPFIWARQTSSQKNSKKIMVTSHKYPIVQNEFATVILIWRQNKPLSMVGRPSGQISFEKVRRNQCSNDLSWFSSEMDLDFFNTSCFRVSHQKVTCCDSRLTHLISVQLAVAHWSYWMLN